MSTRLSNHIIWHEMAIRKVKFHKDEEWDEIDLWGLFNWGGVKHLLDKGLLLTNGRKENHTIWVRPSKEAWEKHIKPLIDKFTPDQLVRLINREE